MPMKTVCRLCLMSFVPVHKNDVAICEAWEEMTLHDRFGGIIKFGWDGGDASSLVITMVEDSERIEYFATPECEDHMLAFLLGRKFRRK